LNNKNTSADIPSCEGALRANDPPLRAYGVRGRAAFGRAAVAVLARGPYQTDPSRQADGESFCFSQEEHGIVALIVAGYSNKDIAHHFSLSQSTIRRRIMRILVKAGLRNKIELVLFMMTCLLSAGAQP